MSVLKRCVIAQAVELRSGALSHCVSSAVCLSFVSFLQQTPKPSPDVSESVIGIKPRRRRHFVTVTVTAS